MACKGSSSCVVNVDAFIMVGLVSFSGNPFFGRAIFFITLQWFAKIFEWITLLDFIPVPVDFD